MSKKFYQFLNLITERKTRKALKKTLETNQKLKQKLFQSEIKVQKFIKRSKIILKSSFVKKN